MNNFPNSVRIKKIVKLTPLVNAYTFDYPKRAKPGQFVNIWVPGVGENPMSIAFDDGKSYTLAIAAVGNTTKELAKKRVGNYIGIRGPYGTNFSWKRGQKIAMLAGGYGTAPLYFAAYLASRENCKIDFFLGGRSREHLLFSDKIKRLKNTRFFPATDDGSCGFNGRNVPCWEIQLAKGEKYDLIMACGPELMEKAVSDIAHAKKIPAQISVERYMKCGFGICGNCCVDDIGIPTCKNGPVMDNKLVRKIKEFGIYHRDSVGRRIYLAGHAPNRI